MASRDQAFRRDLFRLIHQTMSQVLIRQRMKRHEKDFDNEAVGNYESAGVEDPDRANY